MTVRVCILVLATLATGCSAHATMAARGAGQHLCPAADMSAVVQLVNDTRHRAGLRLLGSDPRLARFATSRSAAMAGERRLSHQGWESGLRKAGLVDDVLGENVAYNYATPGAVMAGWMRSPGHRANILGPAFKRLGVGCVIDERGHRWWTQDFAG